MSKIKDALIDLADEIDELIFVGIVGMDGLAVAEYNPGEASVDAFGAKFAIVMKLVEKSIKGIKEMGDFEENLVQSDKAWVLTRYLSPEYYLIIAINRAGTLGSVRMVAQKHGKSLAKLI